MPLPQPIGMMDIVADHRTIGSVHADGGGWVAWDERQIWLGKSDRFRFTCAEAAIAAIEKSYAKRSGITVAATGWRPTR